MKGLNWKGIVTAVILKKVLSWFIGRVLSLLGAPTISRFGQDPSQPINYVKYVPQVYAWSVVISFFLSILCGYIAAGREAKFAIRNAAVMAGLSLVVNYFPSRALYSDTPLWFRICGPVIAVLGALLGGYLRSRRHPKPATSASEVLQPPIPLP